MVGTFPVLEKVLGFSVMFDSFMMLCLENEHWWQGGGAGVYIYRLSFISVPFTMTTEGLDYEGESLSAAQREVRGVDAWLLVQCLHLVPHPSALWHQVN